MSLCASVSVQKCFCFESISVKKTVLQKVCVQKVSVCQNVCASNNKNKNNTKGIFLAIHLQPGTTKQRLQEIQKVIFLWESRKDFRPFLWIVWALLGISLSAASARN